MLKTFFLRAVDLFKDIALALQTFAAPAPKLIPIRVEVQSKHQRCKTRR